VRGVSRNRLRTPGPAPPETHESLISRKAVAVVPLMGLSFNAHYRRFSMTLAELLPALHGLPKCEKLRAIQLLAADVAREDGEMLVPSEAAYPVWSPFDAFDGAATLMRMLNDEKAS